MFLAHTQGDQPELLEEDAVLRPNWKPEPGVGFQILDWTHRELSKQPHRGEEHWRDTSTSTARVLTVRFPHANEYTAQIRGTGSSLTTCPRLQNYQGTTVVLSLTLSFM